MKISRFNKHVSALALCSAFMAMPAYAQDEAAAEENPSALDEIVVTASGRDQTKIESSISVTSIDADLIQDFQPSSEAEVFKLLPGIQVPGTSGPGGNSNIAVRGLPVATGGSPFVQIQEDGLPTVLFGDIQFGNNDYWTHFDASVANVEGVRGGSASTYASQALAEQSLERRLGDLATRAPQSCRPETPLANAAARRTDRDLSMRFVFFGILGLIAAILAEDGYMPRQFAFRGDRLAYSWGIVLLAVFGLMAARSRARCRCAATASAWTAASSTRTCPRSSSTCTTAAST